jgi:hypothetical protein
MGRPEHPSLPAITWANGAKAVLMSVTVGMPSSSSATASWTLHDEDDPQ